MPSQPGVTATSSRIPIDIRRLPWIKPLVVDYAFDHARVAEFFAGDPRDPRAWRDAIARSQAHPRQRDAIAAIVRTQQQQRGAPPEALAATERLRQAETVAVVTGQQAGLFGGPLFSLLKALTAIQLARQVETDHHTPTVAIFLIDSEDHDWDEVKSCGVLDAELAHRHVDVGTPAGAGTEPVARVCLDHAVEQALTDLAGALPQTEFTPAVLETLQNAYRVGASMSEAFGRWLESLLGRFGLIVYDSADRQAKPLVADVFAGEIERSGTTARLASEAGRALEARGYSAQVTPQPGTLALFDLRGGRKLIRTTDDASQLEAGEGATTKAALMARVKEAPGDFSPNVLLRPLVQDTLFPTICYVSGPNELAYLGQLRQVYQSFGVPMPLIYQRATATLLDSSALRFLAKNDVPLENLRAQDEAALNRLLDAQLPPEVDASLQELSRALEEQMARLATAVTQVDATLEGAVRSSLGRVQDDLKKLHAKIIQAEKRKDDTLRRQFHHAQAQAFPGGHPQERAVGFVYFVNKYGPALIDRLTDELVPDMGTHWVLVI